MSETLSKKWDDKFLEEIQIIETYPSYQIPDLIKGWQQFFERQIMPTYHRDYGSLQKKQSNSDSQNFGQIVMQRVDASVIITSICFTIIAHYKLKTVNNAFAKRVHIEGNSSPSAIKRNMGKMLINLVKLGVSVIVSFYPYAVVLDEINKKNTNTDQINVLVERTLVELGTAMSLQNQKDKVITLDEIDVKYLNFIGKHLTAIVLGSSMDRSIAAIKDWDKIEYKYREIDRLKSQKTIPIESDEVSEIETNINQKKKERDSLGFFKFSEKKELDSQIEQLKTIKADLLKTLQDKQVQEIDNKITQIRKEITEMENNM